MHRKKLVIDIPAQAIKSKIETIKSIRAIAGCGLKEAKDIADAGGRHTIMRVFGIDDAYFEENCRILKSNGVKITGEVVEILDSLRDVGSRALIAGYDELANEILQLVLAEKLRRGNGEI